jgi:hypothetical protein
MAPGYGGIPPPAFNPNLVIDPATGLPIAPPFILPPPGGSSVTPGIPLTQTQGAGFGTGPRLGAEQGPGKLEVTRVFSWQEKVYSKSEVLEAQQQAAALGPGGGEVDAWGNVVPTPGEGGLAARGRRGKRTMAIGSQNAANLQNKGGRKGGVVSVVGRCCSWHVGDQDG